MSTRWSRECINVARARQLRKQGLSWRKVGKMLAQEMQRKLPFQPQSVTRAIRDQEDRGT